VIDYNNVPNPKDPTRAPNYSRYVGDVSGMKSQMAMGQWGRAIYNLDTAWSQKAPNPTLDALPPGWVAGSGEPNFGHWNHLQEDFKSQKSPDILAWDSVNDSYPRMRDLEVAAILPDQFDLAYYSIEPDFYHNYYLHLANEYIKNVPGFDYVIRPDLGSRAGAKDITEFSVREQYKVLDRVKTSDPQAHEPKVDFDTKLMYVAKEVEQVLTSWVGKSLTDYSLDTDRFGKCVTQGTTDKAPTSGDCVNGGRTGYSVKMVSSQYLKASDLELGGENVSPGKLLNAPTD